LIEDIGVLISETFSPSKSLRSDLYTKYGGSVEDFREGLLLTMDPKEGAFTIKANCESYVNSVHRKKHMANYDQGFYDKIAKSMICSK
jgi:hypothetical protein